MFCVHISRLITIIVAMAVPFLVFSIFFSYTTATAQSSTVDYDVNDNGFIEIRTIPQLNAIRWDTNTDGVPTSGQESSYNGIFPNAATDMGCPSACTGYELMADLDFDTDGDGRITSADSYWNSGVGWVPIDSFSGVFRGNGYIVKNLFLNETSSTSPVGFFEEIQFGGKVIGFGLRNANVRCPRSNFCGGIAGVNSGTIAASFVAGSVIGGTEFSGGLVGVNRSVIAATFVQGSVRGSKYVGGLAGRSESGSSISASYGLSTVRTSISASNSDCLVRIRQGTFSDNYYDVGVCSLVTFVSVNNRKGINDLQSPTGYTGIYANWNVDIDGVEGGDDPWDFGTASEYPTLKMFSPSRQPKTGMCGQRYECEIGSLVRGSSQDLQNEYIWRCGGLNGGGDVSCSESKGPTVNGSCNNAVRNGCTSGALNDRAFFDGEDAYHWRCDGLNGGTHSNRCSIKRPTIFGFNDWWEIIAYIWNKRTQAWARASCLLPIERPGGVRALVGGAKGDCGRVVGDDVPEGNKGDVRYYHDTDPDGSGVFGKLKGKAWAPLYGWIFFGDEMPDGECYGLAGTARQPRIIDTDPGEGVSLRAIGCAYVPFLKDWILLGRNNPGTVPGETITATLPNDWTGLHIGFVVDNDVTMKTGVKNTDTDSSAESFVTFPFLTIQGCAWSSKSSYWSFGSNPTTAKSGDKCFPEGAGSQYDHLDDIDGESNVPSVIGNRSTAAASVNSNISVGRIGQKVSYNFRCPAGYSRGKLILNTTDGERVEEFDALRRKEYPLTLTTSIISVILRCEDRVGFFNKDAEGNDIVIGANAAGVVIDSFLVSYFNASPSIITEGAVVNFSGKVRNFQDVKKNKLFCSISNGETGEEVFVGDGSWQIDEDNSAMFKLKRHIDKGGNISVFEYDGTNDSAFNAAQGEVVKSFVRNHNFSIDHRDVVVRDTVYSLSCFYKKGGKWNKFTLRRFVKVLPDRRSDRPVSSSETLLPKVLPVSRGNADRCIDLSDGVSHLYIYALDLNDGSRKEVGYQTLDRVFVDYSDKSFVKKDERGVAISRNDLDRSEHSGKKEEIVRSVLLERGVPVGNVGRYTGRVTVKGGKREDVGRCQNGFVWTPPSFSEDRVFVVEAYGNNGVRSQKVVYKPEIERVDGGWTRWTPLANTKVCGASFPQTRSCTNPEPAGGGEQCVGNDRQTEVGSLCEKGSCVGGRCACVAAVGSWNVSCVANAIACGSTCTRVRTNTNADCTSTTESESVAGSLCTKGNCVNNKCVCAPALGSWNVSCVANAIACGSTCTRTRVNTNADCTSTTESDSVAGTQCQPGKVCQSNQCVTRANGVCAVVPDGTIPAAANACSVGAFNDGAVSDTATHWKWRCNGVNGGSVSGICEKHKPIAGGWTDWAPLVSAQACGASFSQTRSCTNPSPAYGGASCSGDSSRSEVGEQCAGSRECQSGVCVQTGTPCPSSYQRSSVIYGGGKACVFSAHSVPGAENTAQYVQGSRRFQGYGSGQITYECQQGTWVKISENCS